MKKQTAGTTANRNNPRLDHETVQNLRCWVLLNYIIGKETGIKSPGPIARPAKRKSVA
jgi:hypothetical protein